LSDSVYRVDTPENVALTFTRAGLATRALAFCIDVVAMAALLRLVAWLLSPFELVASSVATALWIIAGFAVQWCYGAGCEWRFGGRTLGKRLCGIAVIDASGLPLSLPQAAARNLLRVIDLLPGLHLLGALVSLADRDGRRLGDLAARTVVVRNRPGHAHADPRGITRPKLEARTDAPLGSARPYVHELARRLNSQERAALRALCEVRESLPFGERSQLCHALASHLVSRYDASPPSHLSSEKLLLLIQEALRAPAPA
jgi:uncharacterized RDD family membrane protein YckC